MHDWCTEAIDDVGLMHDEYCLKHCRARGDILLGVLSSVQRTICHILQRKRSSWMKQENFYGFRDLCFYEPASSKHGYLLFRLAGAESKIRKSGGGTKGPCIAAEQPNSVLYEMVHFPEQLVCAKIRPLLG